MSSTRRPARIASRTTCTDRRSRSSAPGSARTRASAEARIPATGVRSSCAASATNARIRASAARAWRSACSRSSSISSKATAVRPSSVVGRVGRRRRPRSPRPMERATPVMSSSGRRVRRTTSTRAAAASTRNASEATARMPPREASVSSTDPVPAESASTVPSLRSERRVIPSDVELTELAVTVTASERAARAAGAGSGVVADPGASPSGSGPGSVPPSGSGPGRAETAPPSGLVISTATPCAESRCASASSSSTPTSAAAADARSASRSWICCRSSAPRIACTVSDSATSSTARSASTARIVRVRRDPVRSGASGAVAGARPRVRALTRPPGSRARGRCAGAAVPSPPSSCAAR
ncbi:hypothetical protein BFL35_12920 [Clavibacter michiganensis]|nr:hypothetical protein BFL35_12920 [Clavibacter michiganensis]